MTLKTIKQHWLKLLIVPMLVVAFSFTSVAFAQEGGQQGQDQQQQQPQQGEAADEFMRRNFATSEQRGHVRDRDNAQIDSSRMRERWCNDAWIVQEGESLFQIAALCNIPVQNILAVNPQIGDPSLVFTGEIVELPDYDFVTRPALVDNTRLTQSQQQYLADLGGAGVPVTGEDADEATRRNYITLEQRRVVQQNRDFEERGQEEWRATWCQEEYVVLPGESISDVVLNCNVPINVLLAHNPQISNPSVVFPGEVIRIPSDPFAENQPRPTQAQMDWLNQNFEFDSGEQEGENNG